VLKMGKETSPTFQAPGVMKGPPHISQQDRE
jgi:hypothetical protein